MVPRRPRWYILNPDKTVSPVEDMMAWAAWMDDDSDPMKRRVDFTDIGTNGNLVGVSTCFLGLDHNFRFEGPPILFETMIFGGEYDSEMWRCSTYAEALVQHETACGVVRGTVARFPGRLR
jgi:hypothetical protein